jgi:cation/acetate symporter
MVVGLITSIGGLVIVSPNVFNPEAGKAIFVGHALYPLRTPGIVSIPLGFIAGFIGTILSRKTGKADNQVEFDEILVRSNTGIDNTV